MVHLHETLDAEDGVGTAAATSLTLGFAERRRSRLRASLDDGREAAVLLARGTVLRDGDRLRDPETGLIVAVIAAAEHLSVARTEDRHQPCRAAYHLGNRHVPVQNGADWLAYEHDHVLDAMVEALGLTVSEERRPFEPETGGYGHGHGHGHGHAAAHEHAHEGHEGQGHPHSHAT